MTQGKACGLFDCKASKREIEAELPKIRALAQTPSALELSVLPVNDLGSRFDADPDLLRFIKDNKIYPTFPDKYRDQRETASPVNMADLQYAIQATYDGAANKDAAHELGDVMNTVYSWKGDKEPFNVAVVTKINGGYQFKD